MSSYNNPFPSQANSLPMTKNPAADRAQAMWWWCLASAFRTALACTIVGFATFYGPSSLLHQIAFPAFSYVTVILVVTDATLGDTIQGCWLALYATVQSVGPAVLSLWLIGPAKFTSITISLAVALAAFVVAILEGTHLIAKRIALGQIVIVYVIAFINGVQTEAVMHPLHVAASTALGVGACVLALLFPYPRLACWEVRKNCKVLAENTSERVRLYVKAFCAEDNASASASISQAKSLAIAGTKIIQEIKRYQGSMKWERIPLKFLRPYYKNPGEKLQELEVPLRGMEMSLTSSSSNLLAMLGGKISKEGLLQLEEHLTLNLQRINRSCLPCDSQTIPESKAENLIKFFQTLQTIPKHHRDLPSLFFLFCLKLLHFKSIAEPTISAQESEESTTTSSQRQNNGFFKGINRIIGNKRLMPLPAFKCSLSLGLAVLFGLLYSKENGFWSGLPVAISLASAREATFKVANVKAQGTVLGTVYGVLGCFVFERFLPIRFLSLLPWFLATSFLRRSRMYSQAGGISAVIGAVIILGRKNFGPPSEFAIARIVETFIGLSCSIMVDLLLQPTRASSLAKVQLSKSFGTLHDCIGCIRFGDINKFHLEANQKRLKMDVSELGKFIGEAEVEPNFWFMPFASACYGKLLRSLSKMVDLLLFGAHAVGFLEQESKKFGASWKENVKKLDGDLEPFKEMVCTLTKLFEDVVLLKSLSFLEKELENKSISQDLEQGKSPNENISRGSGSDEDEIKRIMNSYLQHSQELVDKFHAQEGEKELKSQLVLSLSALGYCISNLMKETREIEKGIIELLQLENPSHHINLHDILCKIRTLYP